jgi:glycosyltransferase involved in cell wall biosynthesis
MKNVLFSIITICKNSEETIKKTMDSVLNQWDCNFEYIIIDGGSTDGTLEILREYEEKFLHINKRFIWFSESDSGISDAFNKGIGIAVGDIIGIVNSDDWLEPSALVTINKNYGPDIDVYCGNLRVWNGNNEIYKTRYSRPYLLKFGMYVMHPTVFVKSAVYKNYKFNCNYKIAMDYELILRLFIANLKFKSINGIISNMLLGGVSSNVEDMRLEEKRIMLENLKPIQYSVSRLKLYFEKIIKLL